ncbi:MAG: hypothetical protein JJ971_14370 [Balneolaceae bacterium]|nr:hypothetical protein [Balneolaceae bacterium]MBO6547581.1 hypothetical protein [Balneolaceae bacterium]MBO6648092.1 hypothetical protein [Balneolaceae bacterium]
MKRTSILLILFTFSGTLAAQSLSVSSSPSSSVSLTAKASSNGVMISEANGEELMSAVYNAPGGDPSLETYTLPDGSFIVRENIANFLVYDSFGRIQKSISNSTQSEGGEAISELAMDASGKTIVLFNPKVIRNGLTGSRAKVITSRSVPIDIFYSDERELSAVEVSPNGEFIAFASAKSGTEDEVQIADKFGNFLNTISFDQPIRGVSFSEDGLFVTIYSGGRAAAFEVRSGERVGSTSFRNTTVIFAGYDPVGKTIIGLTGKEGASISEVQLHAVNVSARKIAREEFSENLIIQEQIKLERTGLGRYRISGLDKELDLRASF